MEGNKSIGQKHKQTFDIKCFIKAIDVVYSKLGEYMNS